MPRIALFSCLPIALLGCRETPETARPIVEPKSDDPTTEIEPLGPGTLELSVAACAIAPDRRVWCRDSDLLDSEAGWLPQAQDVEQIWLASETVCVRERGSVRCLAPADSIDAPLPTDGEGRLSSPSGRPVIDVAWGMNQQCLVDDEGTAWCRWLPWEEGVPLPPLERYPIADVRDVELADGLGCMQLADATVHCFFDSTMVLISELDRSLSATVGDLCARFPNTIHCSDSIGGRTDWPAPFRVLDRGRDMAVEANYACLIDDRGAVGCVSLLAAPNGTRIGGTSDFATIPVPAMVEIDGGDDHVCARSESDEVWCWGSNEYGQLGDGTTTSHVEPTPVKVGQWPGLRQISVGFAKSCAVAAAGIECWGWVTGFDDSDLAPTTIPGVKASALASREYTTCARESKAWKCWGAESGGLEGAIGAARIVEVAQYVDRPARECVLDDKRRLTCVDADGKPSLELPGVVDVASGYTSVCALLDRQVACVSPSLPTIGRIDFEVPKSTAITGMQWHGCVLDAKGKAHCWAEPGGPLWVVDLAAKLVTVVATRQGDCGLDRAGEVWCWGTSEADRKPFAIELPKVVELVGGTGPVCARDHDGKVWCWGHSLEPDRSIHPRDRIAMPVPPSQQIVAGFDHVCSLASDGTVSCWGSEIESQRARPSPDFWLRPRAIDFFAPAPTIDPP